MCSCDTGSDISQLASALADPTRARVCVALMDGRAWTAGELSQQTEISPQAMTSCLTKLHTAHIITRIRQGRHSYVALANERVAALIELLGTFAKPEDTTVIGYRQVRADEHLRYARTCYNHIAGHLGILIATAMNAHELIDIEDDSMRLTELGMQWFARNGIELHPHGRTPRIKACLDWTERRFHVAGIAGSALCTHLLKLNLIQRSTPKRALRVTAAGIRWFNSQLGLEEQSLR